MRTAGWLSLMASACFFIGSVSGATLRFAGYYPADYVAPLWFSVIGMIFLALGTALLSRKV